MTRFAVLAAVFLPGSCSSRKIQDDRPHVILVLSDDLGYADLGITGGGEAEEHWPPKRGFDRYLGLISGTSGLASILHSSTSQPSVL